MTAPANSSIPTNVLSIHHTLLLLVFPFYLFIYLFSYLFLLLLFIIAIIKVCSESV